jgi:hypothetical protein
VKKCRLFYQKNLRNLKARFSSAVSCASFVAPFLQSISLCFLLNFSAQFNFRSIHMISPIFLASCSAQPLFGYSCQPPIIFVNLLLLQSISFWLSPTSYCSSQPPIGSLNLPCCSGQHSICLPQPAVVLVNLLFVVPNDCCSAPVSVIMVVSTYCCFSQPPIGCLNLQLLYVDILILMLLVSTFLAHRNLLLFISTFWDSTEPTVASAFG